MHGSHVLCQTTLKYFSEMILCYLSVAANEYLCLYMNSMAEMSIQMLFHKHNIIQLGLYAWWGPGISHILFGIILCVVS